MEQIEFPRSGLRAEIRRVASQQHATGLRIDFYLDIEEAMYNFDIASPCRIFENIAASIHL